MSAEDYIEDWDDWSNRDCDPVYDAAERERSFEETRYLEKTFTRDGSFRRFRLVEDVIRYTDEGKDGEMKVTQVSVKKNKASARNNYEHEHVEVTVGLEKGDDVGEAVDYARLVVDIELGNVDVAKIRADLKKDDRLVSRLKRHGLL